MVVLFQKHSSERPSVQQPTIRVEKRPWGLEEFLIETDSYIGKRLTYRAGEGGGLQYHRDKEETFLIVIGSGVWEFVKDGAIVSETVRAGDLRHIPPGAPHRFTATTTVVGYEWSTPHYNDRVRCEKEYGVEATNEGMPTA